MPKAVEIAAELRRIADVLDKEPEAELVKPTLSFHHWSDKARFLELVKVFPRPFDKEYEPPTDEYANLILKHSTDGLFVFSSILRNAVCRIKTPAQAAEYECEPLLSLEEEEAITA
jgi:hypothetical protein